MSDMNITKIRKLDGGLLLVFKELVECQNATAAAKKLSLSPSAISHAISRMRTLFNDPLFIRKPHGLMPTARAWELLVEVNKILGLAETLLDSHSDFDPSSNSRLFTIAAPEYVTALIGASLVNSWASIAPSASVHYKHLSPDEAVQGVQRGEIDLAVGRFDISLPHSLEQTALYNDSFCVAARKTHPRIRRRITAKQYEKENHVFASALSEVTPSEVKTAPQVVSRTVIGQWLTALIIASETDSLATCHRRLAEQHAKLLGLQILNPPFQPYVFEVIAIHREHPQPAVAWLLNQIHEHIG